MSGPTDLASRRRVRRRLLEEWRERHPFAASADQDALAAWSARYATAVLDGQVPPMPSPTELAIYRRVTRPARVQ